MSVLLRLVFFPLTKDLLLRRNRRRNYWFSLVCSSHVNVSCLSVRVNRSALLYSPVSYSPSNEWRFWRKVLIGLLNFNMKWTLIFLEQLVFLLFVHDITSSFLLCFFISFCLSSKVQNKFRIPIKLEFCLRIYVYGVTVQYYDEVELICCWSWKLGEQRLAVKQKFAFGLLNQYWWTHVHFIVNKAI